MGLAASQARLLSITSRMSDNELRSQLINNAKIRLTTDSARVSDEYVAALNNTKLMFSNFDLAGNEQYQGLTFNALTAYSGYNNQYGIVNSGGEIMVSSLDAGNFERAGGNVDRFLEQYGLEKTTTYFDTLSSNPDFQINNGMGIGYYDTFGEWQNIDTTLEELQIMYEGGVDANGITHYGLEGNYNSSEYAEYLELVDGYNAARGEYSDAVRGAMREFISGLPSTNLFALYQNQFMHWLYLALYSMIDKDENHNYHNHLGSNPVYKPIAMDTDNIVRDDKFKEIIPAINSNLQILNLRLTNSHNMHTYSEYDITEVPVYAQVISTSPASITSRFDENFSFSPSFKKGIKLEPPNRMNREYINGIENGYGDIIPYADTSADVKALYIDLYSNSNYKKLYYRPKTDADGPANIDPSRQFQKDGIDYIITWDGLSDFDNADCKELTCDLSNNSDVDNSVKTTDGKVRLLVDTRETVSLAEARYAASEIISLLRDSYTEFLDESYFNGVNDNIGTSTEVVDAYHNMQTAAEALAQFIWGDTEGSRINGLMFGTDAEHGYYHNLDDQGWVLSAATDTTNRHYNPYNNDPSHPISTTTTLGGQNYQVVKDIFYVECMLERYGVPNYTWIDVNNPEENGDAKAKWYTNLFDRMCQGYKELGAGLASSEEWMQFAFESGLVHMEQVNKSSQWVSTMYSNCSGITESTVDVDITLAEAKYKREMAKIEAKDKKYDMELKNIDTEHESLKQEYESIKKVIQNNIKNNYNMYGNA